MKSRRIHAFLLAMLTGLAAGASTTAYAADTEIYTGSSNIGGHLIKPNILFILDTSGSMASRVSGTTGSRMDNLKTAVDNILDDIDNVNVGLMRFTDVGGPVLYPVADLDAANSTIEGSGSSLSSDVSTVAASSNPSSTTDDDATEDQTSHDVSIHDSELILGQLFGGGTTHTGVTFYPSSSSSGQGDSADELAGSGYTYVPGGGSYDNYWIPANPGPLTIDGYRFDNVTIPPSARITNAVIDWRAASSNAGDLTATINGEARDNATKFQSGSNHNVSHRLENPPTVSTLGPPTNNSVQWPVPDFSYHRTVTSPDLSAIVQEIVCRGAAVSVACPTAGPGTWTSGNAMAFIMQFTGSSYRIPYNADAGSYRPKLNVSYVTGETTTGYGPSTVGLRFLNLAIPQGAHITSAKLKFTASNSSNDSAPANYPSYSITAEKVGDATAFQATSSNISNRVQTAASVTWDSSTGLTNWTAGQTYTTPDLTTVIQELVDQGGWCGNNALNIIVKTTSTTNSRREAYSSDGSAGDAPTLSVNWDPNSIPAAPGGCIKNTMVKQIAASTDDAQQSLSSGSESTGGSTIYISNNYLDGFRFQVIPIQQGATIDSATVTLTAAASTSNNSSFTWQGENIDESPTFTAQSNDLSTRLKTTATATGTQGSWSRNRTYTSTDVKSIIQEIVGRSGWQAGNDLSLFVKGDSNTKYARTFDNSPAKAATLSVTWKSYGNVAPYVKSVRQRLKEIVNDLVPSGYTPTVSTLFEASQYLRGRDVVWGRYRSHISSEKPKTRVSHPASYTGGTDVLPSGCTSLNLSASACAGEYISGNPVYTSPITSNASCAGNYIVLVSDGYANHNDTENGVDHGLSLINNNNTNFPGIGQCATHDPNGVNYSQGEWCGRELAKWMHDNDLNSTLSGDQVVNKFFSVGFNLCSQYIIHPASGPSLCCTVNTDVDSDGNPTCDSSHLVPDNAAQTFLKDLSREGSGGQLNYTDASTATDLENYFNATIAQILAQPTTFAAPTISSNSFNRIFNRNDIYFAPFVPAKTVRWAGNIKKFKICDGIQFPLTGCNFGDVVDKDGNPATDSSGALLSTAPGVWAQPATGGDGIVVDKGGAAAMEPQAVNRKVYTYTGHWPQQSGDSLVLSTAQNTVSQSNITALTTAMSNPSNPSTVINWILGYDVMDENANGNTSENRFIFADPMHSSPVVVQYGGQDFAGGIPTDDCTAAGPVEKLFVGTNDGELHMLNACTGTEEWAWIPQELMPMQPTLMANANGTHLYGLDLTPTVAVHDVNNDGIIDPTTNSTDPDYVHIYMGMRNGGNNVYALDVTPTSTVSTDRSDAGNGQVQPKLMWKILGGTNTTQGDFSHLGKTWSQPVVTKIYVTNASGVQKPTQVVIFGGGDDNSLDYQWGPTPTDTGNIIYIVDALTGDLITSIGGTHDSNGNLDAKLTVADMKYPIPGGIATMDTQGVGITDRLYFGDVGGNIWRVDLNPNLKASSTGSDVGVVGKMADLAAANGATAGSIDPPTPPATDSALPYRRSFYNTPAIVEVRDTSYSDQSDYNLILIGSGSRPHPLGTSVHDQFYALRDFNLAPLVDDGSGLGHAKTCTFNPSTQACEISSVAAPDAYPTLTTTGSDLVNLTNDQLQGADPAACQSQSAPSYCSTLTALQSSAGWYMDLRQNQGSTAVATDYIGEKSLADAIVLQGRLFFTTYVPTLTSAEINECQLSAGDAKIYGINMLNASALFSDWSNPNDTTAPTAATASITVHGGGIPSAVVPYFAPSTSGGISGSSTQASGFVGSGAKEIKIQPGTLFSVNRTYWYEQR